MLEPSKAKKKGVHGQYNGVHDVKIYSTGKAVIDQDYQGKTGQNCIALVMCHNRNVTIEGITFKKYEIWTFYRDGCITECKCQSLYLYRI